MEYMYIYIVDYNMVLAQLNELTVNRILMFWHWLKQLVELLCPGFTQAWRILQNEKKIMSFSFRKVIQQSSR